jgi:hypothetical protein
MRNVSLFAAAMACALLTIFTANSGLAGTSLTTTTPKTLTQKTVTTPAKNPVTSPAQKLAPATKVVNPKVIKKPVIIGAKIMDLVIGTDAAGGWFWEATIKNTSNTSVSGRNFSVQGEKKSFPQAQNPWTPASGSMVSQSTIVANQTVKVRLHWNRCCETDQLRVQLRYTPNNSVLDTKTLTNLLYSPVLRKPVDVRVKRIEWNDSTKKWQATLKNISNYTVKILVQGYLWPQGTATQNPAGGSTVTVPANGEAVAMWLSAPNAQHGDMLKVHQKFIMASCNESNNDCGFKGSNNITIPNSKDYLP